MEYLQTEESLPNHLIEEYCKALHEIERKTGRIFGNTDGHGFPLLLAVRSGASANMPGYDLRMHLCMNQKSLILHVIV